jgi:hypothetical protein
LVKAKKLIISALALALVLCISFSQYSACAQTKGPRVEDLIIRFYADIEQAYNALKNGSIDIVGYEITQDLYEDAVDDLNIVLAPVGDMGMYEFDINNNYTCSEYPGIESPTYRLEFRQAIAYLTPKDRVVSEFCAGFADRIDQPIAYVHRGWRNQSYWYEDVTYPYEYNSSAAAAVLDAGGFLQGDTINPDYDPMYPGSSEYIRTYPSDHPQKPGQDLDPLELWLRNDDIRRLEAGRLLDENLRKLGIPTNRVEYWNPWYPIPLEQGRYHIYTGGWSLGRFPGRSIYGLYHSSQYHPEGSNYVTGVDQNGDPNYPKLDEFLEAAFFPNNHTEAISATKNALGYFTENCITIPLFSARGYWAWSTSPLGIVNSEGSGPVNDYSFMNIIKVDESPIRVGLKTPPNAMNKIYSQWYYDYQCLDRMDLYEGMDIPPYDQSANQPGYILNWVIDSWNDTEEASAEDQIKLRITQTYRDDAWFVEPATGNQLEQVNATHHYASIWYEYQLNDAWNHDAVSDIKYVDITGPQSYDIYWNTSDYWNTYLGAVSIKSFNWWSKGTLSQTVTDNNLVPDGNGYIGCTEPVFYVLSITGDGTPLTLGTDYNIYMDPDGPHAADVRILGAYADVDVTYLATNDVQGYFPGGLSWQDALEGAGMYYATDFVAGAGGFISLKRNEFYPIETPPLGEVDYIRKAGGCFKIDIYDVVIAASAYGTQGTSVPDSKWFPGADLAYPAGQIDIYDIVTTTTKYGTEWDYP